MWDLSIIGRQTADSFIYREHNVLYNDHERLLRGCGNEKGALNLSTTFEFKASYIPRAVGPSGWRF